MNRTNYLFQSSIRIGTNLKKENMGRFYRFLKLEFDSFAIVN